MDFALSTGGQGCILCKPGTANFPARCRWFVVPGKRRAAILFHRGYLWVTSWGDHRIERYELKPEKDGAYAVEQKIVVQGDADFRPTGMAISPDGSLYFADWVDRSYPVHGKGRLWRLELPPEMQTEFHSLENPRGAVAPNLSSLHSKRWNRSVPKDALPRFLRDALATGDPQQRLFAVRWIAEEHLKELLPELERLQNETPPSQRYYLALLAAIDWLNREPKQRGRDIADELLVQEVANPSRSAVSRALALSLLSPDDQKLTLKELREFLGSDSVPLRLAAIRSLADRSNSDRFPVLEEVLRDSSQPVEIRAEALVGLAAKFDKYHNLFETFTDGEEPLLQGEAKRILRLNGLGPYTQRKNRRLETCNSGRICWQSRGMLNPGGDCFIAPSARSVARAIDTVDGVENVGPDLSQIGSQFSRERVITSILDPSREIAPTFCRGSSSLMMVKPSSDCGFPREGTTGLSRTPILPARPLCCPANQSLTESRQLRRLCQLDWKRTCRFRICEIWLRFLMEDRKEIDSDQANHTRIVIVARRFANVLRHGEHL